MSIINGMHKDLSISAHVKPMLSGLPKKKTKHKIILLSVVTLLIFCAVTLSVMIFLTENVSKKERIKNLNAVPLLLSQQPLKVEVSENQLNQKESLFIAPLNENNQSDMTVVAIPKTNAEHSMGDEVSAIKKVSVSANNKSDMQSKAAPKQALESNVIVVAQATSPVEKTLTSVTKKVKPQTIQTSKQTSVAVPKAENTKHLKIESAQLTKLQLANIHLQEATKAQAKGDNNLAAEKWQSALQLQPHLNEVRKSLAMYYYSQNEINKSTSLLKKGALISPKYSDFNLMLSRIALKENDSEKAFLYLEQNPPGVEGNMDYYVSHAILAQKFSQYDRSESLYRSLLTQRPNNGRWLMSLAIAQDKQDKKTAAIASYQKALKKTDLSKKAKEYIRKRLVFLSKE